MSPLSAVASCALRANACSNMVHLAISIAPRSKTNRRSGSLTPRMNGSNKAAFKAFAIGYPVSHYEAGKYFRKEGSLGDWKRNFVCPEKTYVTGLRLRSERSLEYVLDTVIVLIDKLSVKKSNLVKFILICV